MKRILWIMILVVLAMSSCTTRSDKAAVYNDSIIEQQAQIIEAFNQMDSTMLINNDSEMESAYLILRGKVKEGLKSLDTLGNFEKDPILLKASKELFSGYDMLMQDEYQELLNILRMEPEAITPEVIQEAHNLESDIVLKMKDLHSEFRASQMAFGEKYNVNFE
ncbi:MAG: hypothetical protein HRT74_02520 [Flavobacteriales bacterium]|nr:hypothetical protein [Flavobacteriales bacterium]